MVGRPVGPPGWVGPGVEWGPVTRGTRPNGGIRHYFFDMGNDSLLAFFEIPRGAEPKAKRDAIGGMQHVAFAVTPRAFAAIQKRLRQAGVEFDGPLDILPGLVSIYFIDPNGIRLEACCQPKAKEQPKVIGSVAQKRADARRELDTIEAQWAKTTIAAGEFS